MKVSQELHLELIFEVFLPFLFLFLGINAYSLSAFLQTGGARAALSLGGTMLGYYPVKVLPSKTAILPVNPTFLPRVCLDHCLSM